MCDAPQVYALEQTVNSVFYIELLMCVKGSIQQKMSRQWRKKWLLHHNNVLCYTSLTVQFLVQNYISTNPIHNILHIFLHVTSSSS